MSVNIKKESTNNGYSKQESLQAIILADDFIHNLNPAQKIYPSILLPVVTSPLLDYLLETLARSRVQQVFLYLSNHVEKLKLFLDSLKHYQFKNMLITPLVSEGCRSIGDALRDIDTKGCIRGDFILIRGTAFANVNLQLLMDIHQARKEKDKNTALTMVLRDLGSIKDSALKNEFSIVISNANTRKLLYYKKLDIDETKTEFELQWFLDNDKVQIDTALFDTHIYLCSQSVLLLFADNFDFQTMEDFIRGVLLNEEFLNSRIYWEPLICPTYALPISSWKTYEILCRDILQRQCYPLVPDTLLLSIRDFIYMSRSTYKHHNSILSKGCSLHSESIIGESSTLGENSFIKKSIIGSKCEIGSNVCINNSYIISDTVIENDCDVKDTIIFSNCVLKKGTKLDTCILLPYVQCARDYKDVFIEIREDGNLIFKKLEKFTENNDNDMDASSSSSLISAWSSSSSLKDAPPMLQDDNEMFLSEVIDSLLRGYQDKLKCENLILEINSSRYAYNVNIRQVSYNVVKAILNLPLLYYISENNCSLNVKTQIADYHKILKTMLIFFKPIIINYIKTKNAQEDCLHAIQDVAFVNQELILPCVQSLLHFLYDNDILFEEKIIEWYEQDCNKEIDHSEIDDSKLKEKKENIVKNIRTAISPFINWLKEAEEDSSDSS